MPAPNFCLICGTPQTKYTPEDLVLFECRRCGSFRLTRDAEEVAKSSFFPDHRTNFAVSHRIRRMQGEVPPIIDGPDLKEWLKTATLPDLPEQETNVITYIGDHLKGNPGDYITVGVDAFCAVVGTNDADSGNQSNLWFLLNHLESLDWIKVQVDRGHLGDTLELSMPMNGWQRYAAIQDARVTSRRIFMAMKFANDTLSRVVDEHFRPAVAKAGFELFKVNDQNKAGSIDDRIRVEIRTSRMLISDLSDENNGAYWEAGFAEGLGKPVIYTCEKSKFDRVHFDTSHFYCVIWDPENPGTAAEELKYAIRNTLPTEAVMED